MRISYQTKGALISLLVIAACVILKFLGIDVGVALWVALILTVVFAGVYVAIWVVIAVIRQKIHRESGEQK